MNLPQIMGFTAIVLVGLCPNPVSAQPPVELCEAPWMDSERVHALLAVEFGGATVASQIRVESCTGDSAKVVVRFDLDAAAVRESQLDLGQTPASARSRLVALVIAELVRLGSPAGPAEDEPAVDEPVDVAVRGEDAALGEDAADAALREETALGEDAAIREDTALGEDTALSDQAAQETQPETSGLAEADPPSGVSPPAAPEPEPAVAEETPAQVEQSVEEGAASDPCEGWRRFGRGPCSWAVGLSYGLGFHQLGLLGEARLGTTFNHQLRLVGRWRYFFAGVRIYGSGVTGANIAAGGATGLAGLEWWARRWSKNIVALRTGIEAGVHGFYTGAPPDGVCDFGCGEHAEPVLGAFTSVRFERLFGLLRAAVEIELGWSTGFRIDATQDLVTGLGGPWFSLAVELSVGREV